MHEITAENVTSYTRCRPAQLTSWAGLSVCGNVMSLLTSDRRQSGQLRSGHIGDNM